MIVYTDSDDPEAYGDAEYLDFSTEEEVESNSENENENCIKDAEILDSGDPIITEENSNTLPARFKWNDAATIHLIQAYQGYETSVINGDLTLIEVWEEIAKKLQQLGYNLTPLQCKNKFFSLKLMYEKNKEQEISSGVPVKRWKLMNLMEPIMTEMERYKSYSGDSWDSPKRVIIKVENVNAENSETEKNESYHPVQGIYKWEQPAILYLISQYRKYQAALESGSISQKVLFRLIEKHMQNAGYQVTATQCMVKMHSLKKTYKSIKEYNQVNRLIPRRWRYYDLIDSIVQGIPETTNYDPPEEVSETLAEIKSQEPPPPSHIFKWTRRSIDILVTAYRELRPPLNDGKMSRHKVWQIVVQKLRKAGYNVSIGQCKSKISGMLKLYRRNRSGCGGRAWSERGNWYSRLIESIVEKPVKTGQRDFTRRTEETDKVKRADNILDQLIICEENSERRHRENREQRQQLIDIMGQLLERP